MKPKLSGSSLSFLIYLLIALAAFFWMIMRTSVDNNALVFGVPGTSNATTTASPDIAPTTANPQINSIPAVAPAITSPSVTSTTTPTSNIPNTPQPAPDSLNTQPVRPPMDNLQQNIQQNINDTKESMEKKLDEIKSDLQIKLDNSPLMGTTTQQPTGAQ